MKLLPAAHRGLIVACACAALAAPVRAQAPPPGALAGIVRDAAGGPLPGVNVVIAGTARGAATDADGAYRIDGLAPGPATAVFRALGYREETRRVTVLAGTMRLDVTLRDEAVEGREVVVETDAEAAAREAARSTSVLSEADLARVRGQTLGASLERLAGVTTLETGPSISKPVVRGLHSERVLVVNAGVAQEGQQWGGEHAPEIDPFAPARIEVIRGVAGVEYGVGAIGGVIRIEPRELPATPGVGGEAILNAFSNNRQGAASLMVEGGAGDLPLIGRGAGWRVQASTRRAGDAQTPRYGIVNSGFREANGLVAFGLHRDRFGIDVQASRFSTTLGIFKGAHIGNADDLRRAYANGQPFVTAPFSYRIDAPKQTIAHTLLTARGHVQSRAGDRVSLQYGFQNNHRQEYDAHFQGRTLPEGRRAFDLTLQTHTLDARVQHRPAALFGARFVGTVGVSAANQGNVNGEAGQLIPNFRALTGGAFARESAAFGPVTLEAGARYDVRKLTAYPRTLGAGGRFERVETDYGAFTAAAGAVWRIAPAWTLALNAGTAWRPPSVNELYSNGVHHGTGQFEIGDRTLTRERSAGLDATLRHAGPLATFEVSAYANAFDAFLYLRPDTVLTTTFRGAFPTFRYAQTDARLRGLDGEAELRPGGPITLRASASLVRGDDTARNEPLYAMPSDRATLGADLRLPTRAWLSDARLTAEGRFVRRQHRVPALADFAPPPRGYALYNVGVSGTLRFGGAPVVAALGVDNVLDTRYRDYLSRFRYFADNPGRNVVLRVTVPFGRFQP